MNTGSTFSTRQAVRADIPALVELLNELYTIEPQFTPNPEKQRQGLTLAVSKPDLCRILVIEAEGEIAGMATVLFAVSTAYGFMSLHLDDFIITEKHRRNGAGRVLMETVFSLAEKMNAGRVTLNVDMTNNPALAFYKSFMFDPMNLCRYQRFFD